MRKILFTAACCRAINRKIPNDGTLTERVWNNYCLFRRLWLNPGIAQIVWAKEHDWH
jgi:hypothetical protein